MLVGDEEYGNDMQRLWIILVPAQDPRQCQRLNPWIGRQSALTERRKQSVGSKYGQDELQIPILDWITSRDGYRHSVLLWSLIAR